MTGGDLVSADYPHLPSTLVQSLAARSLEDATRVRVERARALFLRGLTYGAEGDFDAAIADYTSIIEIYGDDPDPEMRLLVAKALEELAKVAN